MKLRRLRTLALSLALSLPLAIVSSPTPARADGGCAECAPLVFGIGLPLLTAPVVGLVTDIGIGAHMASGDGTVPLTWSITGTASWGVSSAASLALVAWAHNADAHQHWTTDQKMPVYAFAYSALAVSALNEAFSIYALGRRGPSSATLDGAPALPPSGPRIVPFVNAVPSSVSVGVFGQF